MKEERKTYREGEIRDTFTTVTSLNKDEQNKKLSLNNLNANFYITNK